MFPEIDTDRDSEEQHDLIWEDSTIFLDVPIMLSAL